MKDKDSLWVRVITEKYIRHEHVSCLDLKHIRNASNAWNGMAKAHFIVENGARMRVGIGRSIQFWLDKWLLAEPLINQLSGVISLAKQHKVVRDYWDPIEGWAWTFLDALLPTSVLDKLATIFLVDEECNSDSITWAVTSNGNFTVSSAYDIALATPRKHEHPLWLRIWKLNVPNRMQALMWLIAHGKVLTNVERSLRGFTANSSCILCRDPREDIDHLWRSCPLTYVVWRNFLFPLEIAT